MNNFSHPQKILELIGVGQASVVVDLGSGSGHYTLASARMTGPEGKVYAVDVQADLLERTVQQAQQEGVTNIEIIHADIEVPMGTKVQTETADLVLLCNTLFQLEDKVAALQEAQRIMRPNARLLIVDWTDSHGGLGPDAQLVCDQANAEDLLKEQGLTVDRSFDAGDHHYGIISRKKSK